jgi:flagellar FliJ protein
VKPASIQSLQVVLEHAEQERDAAREALRQAEEAAARSQAQAAQLHQYRAEYRLRWQAQFARSGTPELLQCHHAFAQRLDHALEQQARQVAGSEQRVAMARKLLQAREQRLAAVRKLIERRLQALQQQAGRLDQKQTDESAQRAAWAARAAADFH